MDQYCLYDLNVDIKNELDAWNTRVIRSHRVSKNSRLSHIRATAVLAVCVASGASLVSFTGEPNGSSGPVHSVVAQTPTPQQTAPESGSETFTDPPIEPREVPHHSSRSQQTRSAPVEIVIGYAVAQVGKRYVFGASGPNTFDCSGLVMRSFEKIGINLPHYTGAILSYGRRVNRYELTRGDIVFPNSGHVGIYLGNGMFVAASNPQTGIKISSLYSFYTARRLL